MINEQEVKEVILSKENLQQVYDTIFNYVLCKEETPDIVIDTFGTLQDIAKAEFVRMSRDNDGIKLLYKDKLNIPIKLEININDKVKIDPTNIDETIVITNHVYDNYKIIISYYG